MALVAGSLDANGEFVEPLSLARCMDAALPRLRDAEFGKSERRALLIAIATGIIDYATRLLAQPERKVIAMHSGCQIILDDAPGSGAIELRDATGGIRLRLDAQAIVAALGANSIRLDDTAIELRRGTMDIRIGDASVAINGSSLEVT